jgi:hypothetical protein
MTVSVLTTFVPVVIIYIYVSFWDIKLMSVNSVLCLWAINVTLIMLSGILSCYVTVTFYAGHFISHSPCHILHHLCSSPLANMSYTVMHWHNYEHQRNKY